MQTLKRFSFLSLFLSTLCLGIPGDIYAQDNSQVAVTIQRQSSGDFTPGFAGFRGYRFGRSHWGMSDLKVRSVRGQITWYNVEHRPQIGHAWMKSLGFGFRNDKFYGVMGVPETYRDYLELKSNLYNVYGAPFVTHKTLNSITYIWKVQPGVILKLFLYTANRGIAGRNEMILTFVSGPILLGKTYR